jgi:hypothetical protein
MRMSMRRFTRLTNAFSKKLENLQASVAMHLARYNLVRPHKTLRPATCRQAWSAHQQPYFGDSARFSIFSDPSSHPGGNL